MDGPALPARPCRTVLPGRLGQRRLLEAWDAAAGPLPVRPCGTLGPDHRVAVEPGHSFVFSVEMFSDSVCSIS